ncbi:uncharacterized protein LOC116211561 [Punica granatum]|uniref:Maternal effect embryo arrest 59 n=2 Tax=Punica granatum TaxID=22663 RepID=A0A218W977_PUNGR|nr:uncharacterized protein LOC116211561 [Punica granatum]OWM68761.1 hypothetical protein CDL15_Pgr024948 [Punica granatum]PKI66475.1 hypothetical protein CRG98_013131 [Punica granatum]
MESFRRPNRSDVHLSRDEEVKAEEETRDYFDGIAPKRHTKPRRSEDSSNYVDALSSNGVDNPTPELVEFQRLEGSTQKLNYSGSQVEEEFMETAYYKDLNNVDKQHHQTGTGFIKVDNSSDGSFNLTPDTSTGLHASCKGNPATNDWIPSAADTVSQKSAPDQDLIASDKPNRSEN